MEEPPLTHDTRLYSSLSDKLAKNSFIGRFGQVIKEEELYEQSTAAHGRHIVLDLGQAGVVYRTQISNFFANTKGFTDGMAWCIDEVYTRTLEEFVKVLNKSPLDFFNYVERLMLSQLVENVILSMEYLDLENLTSLCKATMMSMYPIVQLPLQRANVQNLQAPAIMDAAASLLPVDGGYSFQYAYYHPVQITLTYLVVQEYFYFNRG